MSLLFSPLTIRELTLKNRLVVSPMCQYSSVDGFADNWHLVHLGSRAVGGAAVILTEATAVSPEGRISPGDLGIWKDEHVPFLKNITDFIHHNGSIAGVQLAHAGRKASSLSSWEGGHPLTEEQGAWQTFSASAIPFKPEQPIPIELDQAGIDKVVSDFKAAAVRSLDAGFKIIEIHAAHGYLINQFLSPLSNRRTDVYGGRFENRIRILLDIVKEVRTIWPLTLPVFVRISATEYAEGGWTIEDSVALSTVLKHMEVDVIDCSSGGNTANVRIPLKPGYQVPFAEKIKKDTTILTAAVGLITQAQQAEDILADGQADLIVIAREFLRDPYFPLHAAKALGVEIDWPLQYQRAK